MLRATKILFPPFRDCLSLSLFFSPKLRFVTWTFSFFSDLLSLFMRDVVAFNSMSYFLFRFNEPWPKIYQLPRKYGKYGWLQKQKAVIYFSFITYAMQHGLLRRRVVLLSHLLAYFRVEIKYFFDPKPPTKTKTSVSFFKKIRCNIS